MNQKIKTDSLFLRLLLVVSILIPVAFGGAAGFMALEDLSFGDAFYFTIVTLSTVGFGDIIPYSGAGKWVTVLMILSGIILIPWHISQIVREWVHMASKREIQCPQCGLRYHDMDASHCKSCGHVIFQTYDGD